MHAVERLKPDGRRITLYSRTPLAADGPAPSPFANPLHPRPHYRWHPLRGEWITYAAYRQNRTFLPPPEYDPLAPTVDIAFPTEVPDDPWEIAVFDNRFPSLATHADAPPASIVPTAPANGHCEVVVFTPEREGSLAAMPRARIELLIEVWADRTARLAAREGIRYVLPFENRGAEVGVTLHHPHGQIYAYPFVPPVPANMQRVAAAHYREHGSGPLAAHIAREIEDGRRLLYRGEHAVAFVPACARYPYETWIAPIAPVATFGDLSDAQRADLARALQTVLRKYDALWHRPLPYLMSWYQAPVDGEPHPESHLHAEIWPPYRTPDRLKYLAGTEIAAGLFAMDALPEDKAAELQAVAVEIDP